MIGCGVFIVDHMKGMTGDELGMLPLMFNHISL